jgi:hypothetical protein
MVTLMFAKTGFMGYLLFTKLIGRDCVSLDENCLTNGMLDTTNGYLDTTNGYLDTMLDRVSRYSMIIVDLDCINMVNVMKDGSHGVPVRA